MKEYILALLVIALAFLPPQGLRCSAVLCACNELNLRASMTWIVLPLIVPLAAFYAI